MAWCHQATNPCFRLSQSWSRSLLPYGVAGPQMGIFFKPYSWTANAVTSQRKPVQAKNVRHIRHFRWLGPNVWWEISQIYVEYIKPVRQMAEQPWKFFTYTGKLCNVITYPFPDCRWQDSLSWAPWCCLLVKWQCTPDGRHSHQIPSGIWRCLKWEEKTSHSFVHRHILYICYLTFF